MAQYVWYLTFLSLSASLLVFKLNKGPLDDFKACFISRTCFGDSLCANLNKVQLRFDTIAEYFNAFFGVKNVYRAIYANESVILKKSRETLRFEANRDNIMGLLLHNGDLKDFVVCDSLTGDRFLNVLQTVGYNLSQIYYFIEEHVEPLICEVFKNENHFRVPKLLGLCGRLTMVTDCGRNLNDFRASSWSVRAYLASQLLESVLNFTLNHEMFALYLTDISADNVAVNGEYGITFIDLENAVLAGRNRLNGSVHYSEHFQDDDYGFSVKGICGRGVSDHNIYAVCRVLLSKYSPWPMMEGGLLHSPPNYIAETYRELLNDVEKCVWSEDKLNRFDLAENIITMLRKAVTELDEQEIFKL